MLTWSEGSFSKNRTVDAWNSLPEKVTNYKSILSFGKGHNFWENSDLNFGTVFNFNFPTVRSNFVLMLTTEAFVLPDSVNSHIISYHIRHTVKIPCG